MGTTPLPPLYARWMLECLGGELPSEDRATCLDCAMCGDAAERDGTTADLRFNPSTKCCTYHPTLPNFAVGALLDDETPGLTGRPVVAARIRERLGATPLGLFASPTFERRFAEVGALGADVSGWGRDPGMLCPYYDAGDGGLCGVWLHRNGECSTWFCKHRDGALGKRFWVAMSALLTAADRALVRWCVQELMPDPRALGELYDAEAPRPINERGPEGGVDDDGRLDPRLHRRLWGPWDGREEEFYRACAARVAPLDWRGVLALGGRPLAALEERMKASRPEPLASSKVLCRGQFAVLPLSPTRLRLRTAEASYEPLDLPVELVRALGAFDGRPTDEVLADLEKDGLEVRADTVQAMRRRGILVPPDGLDLPPNARGDGPLAPDDVLRFFRGYRAAEPSLKESVGKGGATTLTLSCGGPSASFSDPGSFAFVRALHRHGLGFRAGEAAAWIGGGPGSWEAVRGVLEGLLAGELLQRDPRPAPLP